MTGSHTINVGMYVGMYVCRFVYKQYVCQNAWTQLRVPNTRMLKVSFGWLKPNSFKLYARAALAWTKKQLQTFT